MSKSKNIPPVELYDEFGNLSMEALIAFAKGELNDTQKLEVQQAIDADEMYADALEGILELEQPEDTRHAVYSINEKVRAQTGMQQSMSVSPQVWRIAAAVALFVTLSGSIIYVVLNTNFVNDVASNQAEEKPLADNTAKESEQKSESTHYWEQSADSSIETKEMIELSDEDVVVEMEAQELQEKMPQTGEVAKSGTPSSNDRTADKKASDPAVKAMTATGGSGIPMEEKTGNSVSLNGYLSQPENKKEAVTRNVEIKNNNVPAKPDAKKEELLNKKKDLEDQLDMLKAQEVSDKARAKAENEASAKKVAEQKRKEEEAQLAAESSKHQERERSASKSSAKQIELAEAEPSYDAAADDMEESVTISGNTSAEYQQKDASFPGGQKAMKEYLNKNIKFESETQGGTVLVSFEVDEKGRVQNAKVARGIAKDIDNEALRVVKSMPKWTPAEQNGKKVRSQVVVPVDIQPKW